MRLCYMDGNFLPFDRAALPLSDHIILRGIGVFDLVRTYGRRPMMMTYHLERLLKSASALGIENKLGVEAMKSIVREGIGRMDGDGEVLVNFYITGGDNFVDGCRFPDPRYFVSFQDLVLPDKELYSKGVRLFPLDRARLMPSAKSIDYSAALAKNSVDPGALEVLYCPGGGITEAGHSSFFMIKDGKVVTAPDDVVLAGTTRSLLLQILTENEIDLELRVPSLEELSEAQEAFITGSVKEIMPVVQVGDMTVGDGNPGEFTGRIRTLYRENIPRWLE
ncbi:aminotransferase class IV [Dethiosulfovibrio sp. F2B]|uniref:aminotransferase class IV n=1 Tax=Dethiosulfovibrio faecalis TaxID=2720018 RepID=UPI001F1E6443|nr:aminotransferase class IV [Dethiosulfovibrio faecalis]MCF4150278.1 aminotransferase class IV [Dethiosulfovibrio faecalis]MEA3285479.1 aminotransferase class IV [Synergistota bacterium]